MLRPVFFGYTSVRCLRVPLCITRRTRLIIAEVDGGFSFEATGATDEDSLVAANEAVLDQEFTALDFPRRATRAPPPTRSMAWVRQSTRWGTILIRLAEPERTTGTREPTAASTRAEVAQTARDRDPSAMLTGSLADVSSYP